MELNNLIFAHRGAHNNVDIPENSIEAIKCAIENNLNIELDVQLTKDNILVVFHDENLKRMTGHDVNLKDITFNELKKLKLLNTNQTIPTLKEILNMVNGKVILDIEIKNYNKKRLICKKLVEELNSYNYKFIVKSFDPKIVYWFKKHKKEYIRGLLIKDEIYNRLIGKIIIKYCNPNFLSISKKYINNFGIKKYISKYPILVWTILDKKEINKYKKITNNYICNNLPFNDN